MEKDIGTGRFEARNTWRRNVQLETHEGQVIDHSICTIRLTGQKCAHQPFRSVPWVHVETNVEWLWYSLFQGEACNIESWSDLRAGCDGSVTKRKKSGVLEEMTKFCDWNQTTSQAMSPLGSKIELTYQETLF